MAITSAAAEVAAPSRGEQDAEPSAVRVADVPFTVMPSGWMFLPEEEALRNQPIATPAGRTGHLAVLKSLFYVVECDSQLIRVEDRITLPPRSYGDLHIPRPAGEGFFVFGQRGLGNHASNSNLSAQLAPKNQQCCARVGAEMGALGARSVGEEDQSTAVDAVQYHHARIRRAVRVGGRQRHCFRQGDTGCTCIGKPALEQLDRIYIGHRRVVS